MTIDIETAKSVAIILLGLVPLVSVIVVCINRWQLKRSIGGRVTQFAMGTSFLALLGIAMLIGIATWDAVEKLLLAIVAFIGGVYVSNRTNFQKSDD